MRLKLTMLVLLLFSSFSHKMHAWAFGIPFISWDADDVERLGSYVTDPLGVENRWAAYGTGWLIIGSGMYATQDYWYKPIVNYLNKNNSSSNTKNGRQDDANIAEFSKSRARILQPGDITTRLQDVAGLKSVKLDVFDVIQFLKNPKAYNDMGAKIPKGMLFNGPPGVGKTLLAKAIAGECGCPFISVCASEFEEMYVGVGAARVRDLFAKAKELAPCILFIDEFDAIGKKRTSGSGASDAQAQTLGQLLTSMDGFDMQKYPIIVLAATNRAEVLDPAIVRPGRFDRSIEISLPFFKDRIEILQVHLRAIKASSNIDVPLIARATTGFSGAKLANLVNEAAILAVNEQSSCVEMKHIDQAYDNITLGRETQGMDDLLDDEMFETAIHEAGHSIVRVFLEHAMPLYKVTITPRSTALGISFARPLRETYSLKENEMKAHIIVCLAGGLAEQEFGFGQSTGRSNDIQVARAIAYDMVTKYGMTEELRYISYSGIDHNLSNDVATKIDVEVKKIIDECYNIAKDMIKEHRAEIKQLADLLMKEGTVFGDVVYRMCGVSEPKIEFGLAK